MAGRIQLTARQIKEGTDTAFWVSVMKELTERRSMMLDRLVEEEDPEVRGAIKELNHIINLPESFVEELEG